MSNRILNQYLSGIPKEITDALDSSVRVSPSGTIRYYVRNSGNDTADGLSEATALATISEAARRLVDNNSDTLRQVIDLTGYTVSSAEELRITLSKAPYRYTLDYSRPDGTPEKEDVFNLPVELHADPILVRNITVDSVTVDSVTQLSTINVTDTLTVDELKGMAIVAGLFEVGIVQSNTASAIIVSGYTTAYSGTLPVYTQSCIIDQPLTVQTESVAIFKGIKFGPKFAYFGTEPLYLSRCHFNGTNLTCAFSGYFAPVNCYQTGGYFTVDGVGYWMSNCVLQGVAIGGHGTGGVGYGDWSYCVIDSCSPVGEGNHESATAVELSNCLINNATTSGINRQSSYASRTTRVRINNSVQHGIVLSAGGGYHKFNRVVGSGNGGYGVYMAFGTQALDQGNNTITGTSGDIRLGGTTTTWVTIDALSTGQSVNDSLATYPEFCRIQA